MIAYLRLSKEGRGGDIAHLLQGPDPRTGRKGIFFLCAPETVMVTFESGIKSLAVPFDLWSVIVTVCL